MRAQRIEKVATAAILSAVITFIIANLRPWLWVLDTTPTGGDLGAHVWAPAYLRDVLLPDMRLTGWSHDWYAGFPVFTFYMVIPSLLVVIVEAGIPLPVDVYAHASAIVAASLACWHYAASQPARQRTAACIAAATAMAAMQVLERLDGFTVRLPALGDFTYNDMSVDRFLAAVLLPVSVGWLAWTVLPATAPSVSALSAATPTGGRLTRGPLCAAAVMATLLIIPMPYGVAFKLTAVAGVALLPLAAYTMARFSDLAFPGPALAAAAVLPFLFDLSYNIYGGNLMSTMAGEFAYSLGFTCAVIYIGVAVRGMSTGRHRVLAGSLLALTGLTHLFPAFLALVVTGVLLSMSLRDRSTLWASGKWTATVGSLAAALSAWWVWPFWWNRNLLNDMGWGKESRYLSALWSRTEFDYDFLTNDPVLQIFVVLAVLGTVVCLVRRERLPLTLAMTALVFAAAFVILPEGRLWNVRILPFYYFSVYLTAILGFGVAARSAASSVKRLSGLIGRHVPRRGTQHSDDTERSPEAEAPECIAVSSRTDSPARSRSDSIVSAIAAIMATGALIVAVGLPLRGLPGGRVNASGTYEWGPFETTSINFGPSWLEYNYEGYELKEPIAAGGGYSEYRGLIDTMEGVAEEHGCGTSFWEYESDRIGSYGTPMAPMLLPYWTNQCVGSMEGLYFETSATVPYHFMMQSELSAAPSRAQRDLPYSDLDVHSGVEHMKLMGVRYYMAFSHEAVAQARSSDSLTEIAESGPWSVFLVEDSDPVVGLAELPIVAEGLSADDDSWLEVSAGAFLAVDGTHGSPLFFVSDGPDDWPRIRLTSLHEELDEARHDAALLGSPRERVIRRLAELLPEAVPRLAVNTPAKVSDIERNEHSISFSVDRVGVPVLVRTSYFPNWSASGADGPYRVTPNLMTVVPTDTEVVLSYGRSPVELISLLVTAIGLVAVLSIPWWLSKRSSKPTISEVS